MPFIGNQPTSETIADHKTYTGDGTRTVFGVQYTGNFVSVYQNGIKLTENNDYTINDSGVYITFAIAPELGDTISLVGENEITDLARSSYVRESFTSTASQTIFQLNSNIKASDRINVFLNGLKLSEIDYTLDYTNNRVTFASGRAVNDVVAVEIFTPGFRSDSHFTRGDKAHHLGVANPSSLNNDVTIDADENAMMVGPLTINSVVTVNGNLTIV
jgi:hypothetical protein